MAGNDVVGKATFQTEVDASGVAKGMDDAERRIKQTGKATEDAFARQGTQAMGKFRGALDGMLAKVERFQRGGGITGALMGGVGLGAGLGAFGVVTGALSGVVDGFNDAVAAASDLAESSSKVGVVFGQSAGAIERWSDTAATAMGLSKQKALEAAGTFGNLFDALKLTDAAQLDMSKGAVQLAADLASFNNADITETLQAIQSGLLGEAEPMRKFGASLSEARTQAYAMENGLGEMIKSGKTWKFVMSDADKVTARYRLILQDTANAQGDYARTADGMANSQRTNAARAADLQAKVGSLVAPLGTALVEAGGAAFDAIDTLGGAFHELWRAMDPGQAVVEDTEKLLRDMGEAYGFDADAVIEFMRVQREARQAQDQTNRSMRDAADYERQFQDEYIRTSGVMADGLITQQEQADLNEWVYHQMEDAGFVIDEVTGKWKDFDRQMAATQAATDNTRKVLFSFMSVQGIKALLKGGQEFVDFWGGLGSSAEDAGDTVKAETTKAKQEVAAFVPFVTASMDRVRNKRGKGWHWKKDISTQLHDLRVQFRDDLAEIDYLMKHPDQATKTRAQLIKEQTRLEKLQAKALRENNIPAYEDITKKLEAVDSQISEIDGRVATVTVQMNEDRLQTDLDRLNRMLRGSGSPNSRYYLPGYTTSEHRAAGGPVSPFRTYLVGEEGPELLTLGAIAGHVTSNRDMRQGSTRTVVHEHRHTITAQGAQALRSAGYDDRRVAGFLLASTAEVLTPMEAW